MHCKVESIENLRSFEKDPIQTAHEEAHASGRMDLTRGNFKPKSASLILQALCCRFFGCNLLVFVFLAFRICGCFV